MTLILNIETATTNCSVCIAKNGNILAIKEHDTPNYSHSEQLHLFVEEILRQASVSLPEIDAIAISKGPGSYTGLRIGVSAAKGLCFSLDIPLISTATLKSMAYQSKPVAIDYIIPVLDARRMEVYSHVFDADLNTVRGTKADIIDLGSYAEYTKKGKVLLVGNGAEKCKGILEHSNFSFDTTIVPSASEMATLSYEKYKNGDFEDTAYFEPYYLKDFIALKKKIK